MTDAAIDSLMILISAPSGGGKTTLCERVLATNPMATRVVTCTTRPPRAGEVDGVHYYFFDSGTFERKVTNDEFLEHATVHGNHYGVLKSEVIAKLRLGKDVLLSVDVQGAATIRAKAAGDPILRKALVTVFITPPSMTVLEERLRKRGQNSVDDIARRLSMAREEIAHWVEYDYLIISTTVSEDLRRMEAIMLAEKMRQGRVQLPQV